MHKRELQKDLRQNGPSRWRSSTTAALFRLALFLLSLLILVVTVEVAPAQEQSSELKQATQTPSRFRVERTTVAGGAELLTIWARVVQPEPAGTSNEGQGETLNRIDELPLVSVLRDTLGDASHENDVLTNLWVHSYVRPKLSQRAAALIPFLYKGVRVERSAALKAPRPIINLSETSQPVWQRFFIAGVTTAAVRHPLLKASIHNYQRNISDYRQSNLMRALTTLSLYESETSPSSDSPFSEAELIQMQAQLALSEKILGGIVDNIHFRSTYEKTATRSRDLSGHNWELLRQQAEASGLYFEPLGLSNETVTHALLWVPADKLRGDSKTNQTFQGRFLNIKNPWSDKRLREWKGYSEIRSFKREGDPASEGQRIGPESSSSMIPLALYGLNFQKIPALLIDFRDSANPRRRELSGRLINDITRDVLSISRFGNVYYFLASSAFNFITSRRGIDINQPSRIRSAAELRLLLSLDPGLSDGLRAELNRGLENLTINPLENSGRDEGELALAQHKALQAYALLPDGLPAQLQRERGAEAAKLLHRGWDGKLMRLANVLTFGRYIHRDRMTPDLLRQLDQERQLAHHVRFLREVAKSSPEVEVAWSMEKVMPSLRWVAENGTDKNRDAAKVVGSIFSRTRDIQARGLCLSALKRIGNKEARREMLRIYQDATVPEEWRTASAEYLKLVPPTTQPQDPSLVGTGVRQSSDTRGRSAIDQ